MLWIIQFQPLSLKETPKSESGEGLAIYYHFIGWRFNLILQTLRNSPEKPVLPGPQGTPLASTYLPRITASSLHAAHTPA